MINQYIYILIVRRVESDHARPLTLRQDVRGTIPLFTMSRCVNVLIYNKRNNYSTSFK